MEETEQAYDSMYAQLEKKVTDTDKKIEDSYNSHIDNMYKKFAEFSKVQINPNLGLNTKKFAHSWNSTVDKVKQYGGNGLVTFDMRKMPEYAQGGIIDKPTVALVGEAGREAVMPLERNTQWIDELALKLTEKGGSNGSPIQLVVKIGEDTILDKVIDGITDLRDESNRDGIKIVIELRRDANANVVLNNLYKHTSLQMSYGINNLALVDGEPKVLGLKQILERYLDHQREIIIRRTQFDLGKATDRAHILEGLKIALDNIDELVQLLKKAKNDEEALKEMMERYKLTEIQGKAILEMRLRRLTGLEREKIIEELKELEALIADLKDILNREERVLEIIKNESLEIKNKYGDERRTNIDMSAIDYIEDESLIPVEDSVITLTNKGYIKRINSEAYKTQNRGGVGVKGITTNEEDFVENMITLTTHDYLMFFTNKGKVYRMKGYEIPEYSRQSKGLPIVNLLPIEKDENVTAMLKVQKEDSAKYIVFCTQNGIVKRTDIKEFENIRQSGKIAITLKENDQLVAAKKTDGNNEIFIAASNGRMIRFNENEIRVMGRSASGVRGIEIDDGIVVGCEIAINGHKILVVTENGYGKQTDMEEYRLTHRGSKGVKALNITEKNGNIVAVKTIDGNEDLMISTNTGVVIRLSVSQISKTGRVAQGVKLINLKDNQKVSTVAIVLESENSSETIEKEG